MLIRPTRVKAATELALIGMVLVVIGAGCWMVHPAAGLVVPGLLVWLEIVRR